MSSHVKPKVNDNLKEWMNSNYGKHDEVKANRNKVHDYLGMPFDFTDKGKVKIKMDEYAERMINKSPMKH